MKLYQCKECFEAYRLDLGRLFQRSCKPVRADSKRTCECGQRATRVRVLVKLKEGMALGVAGKQQLTVQGAAQVAKGRSVLSQDDAETKARRCVQCGNTGRRRQAGGVLTRWAYCESCWDKHLEQRREFVNRATLAFNRTRPKDTEVYLTTKGQQVLELLYTEQVEGKEGGE